MKILFATMQFGHGYGQGTERYIAMLAAGLLQRGHDVAILGGDPEHRGPRLPLGTEFESSPRVLHYPTHGWAAVHGEPVGRLRAVLQRERPDIVHLVNPGHIGVNLIPAAREAGIPVVVTVVDFWWLCPKQILLHYRRGICDGRVPWLECVHCLGASDTRGWVRGLALTPVVRSTALPILTLARAVVRGATLRDCLSWPNRQAVALAALDSANAVILLSQGARERLTPRLKHPVLHLIPVGMEPRWFAARRAQPFGPTPRDPARLILGFAGALAEHKGPHVLLAAIRQLGWTNTRVRLAGGGPDRRYEQRLRKLAAGLNVEFVGRMASADMPAFVRDVDLLIVPSIWPENQPQTVLEAQAVGTPVIASRVDGISEVMSDPALLFEPGAATDLARCLADWACSPRNPPPARPVSTADTMVEQTLAAYASLKTR